MIAVKERARTSISVGRLDRTRIISWVSLGFPLLVSALLNFWNLAQNGYSNLYYSVAVQSMMQNWHNFFFGAYDAGGFITVDKPPVALWIQTISAKIFGFSNFSLLLPEALAGVAAVALVYFLVRRIFGTLAGSVAALAMALTPIAVAVDRTNNMDTLLMFTILLAAWALTLATERGRLKMLLVSLALVGVAFNIKMLAAFIVLPAFYLVYLVAARTSWQKRILHLALGSVVLFTVALSWPLAVDLTPASERPWVGGSQSNSVLDLALGYNGLGRVNGNEQLGGPGARNGIGGPGGFGGNGGRRGPGGFGGGQQFPLQPPGTFPGAGGNQLPGGGGFPGSGQGGFPGGAPGGIASGGLFGAGQPGWARLFTGEMAGQWSWLFPLALFGVVAAALTVRRRWPLDPRAQSILLWSGWLATYAVIFSIASGIFHPYYLIMLAPPTAALVGLGVSSLVMLYRRGGWQARMLPAALFATALWQMHALSPYPQWSAWLTPLLLTGSIATALGLAASRTLNVRIWRRWSPGLVAVALVALLLTPLTWSITPVLAGPSNASLPVAGPEALNQNDPTSWTRLNGTANSTLVSYLEANQDGYFYLLAVANSQQASSIALSTGKPVLSTGGFMGSDPALTADGLAALVANKQVRFVMGLGGGFGGIFGGRGQGSASDTSVNGWVQQNCSAVDTSLYGGTSGIVGFTGSFGFGNDSELYNCAPVQ